MQCLLNCAEIWSVDRVNRCPPTQKQFCFQMLVQRFDVKVIGGIFRGNVSAILPAFVTLDAGPSHLRLYLSCGWNLSYPDVCANTKFAVSFPKEKLITETKAVKIDKPFLLSALLSVGSLKQHCSHGSLWLAGQAWPTTGIARRGCSRDGCRRRNPDYCHWQLVDLRWLVSSPLPFFCLSDVQKPAWQR